MKVTYDTRNDLAYIAFCTIVHGEAVRQAHCGPDIILDFDTAGHLLGVEVLSAERLLRAETLAGAVSPDV